MKPPSHPQPNLAQQGKEVSEGVVLKKQQPNFISKFPRLEGKI